MHTHSTVAQSGFSQDASRDITWGIALADTSETESAVDVHVTMRLHTDGGKLVSPQSIGMAAPPHLEFVPAHSTVYLGDVDWLFPGLGSPARIPKIKTITYTLKIGETSGYAYQLPSVTVTRIDLNDGSVTGELHPFDASIVPYEYETSTVFFNRQGQIIGGDLHNAIGTTSTPSHKGIGSSPVSLIRSGHSWPVSIDILYGHFPPGEPTSARISFLSCHQDC